MTRVFTDASVRGGHVGMAFITDRQEGMCSMPGRDVFAGELTAVIKALEAFPVGDVEIVCDHVCVRNGIGGHRYPIAHSLGAGKLWLEFDRVAAGRVVTAVPPQRKNKGLHGRAHKLARAAAKRAMRAAIRKTLSSSNVPVAP